MRTREAGSLTILAMGHLSRPLAPVAQAGGADDPRERNAAVRAQPAVGDGESGGFERSPLTGMQDDGAPPTAHATDQVSKDADLELRSLRRGLDALRLLNQVERLSIARAATLLKLPRTTAERILNALVTDGYLVRSPVDKQYHLTPKVKGLSSGFSGDTWVTHIATPLLNQLTEEIGWPLAIASAEGADMHVRYTTDTMTSLWLNRRRVGATIPIPRASSGIVHLAFASAAERRELESLIASTYPDSPLDTAQVEAAREAGYAFSPHEHREQSISVPILLDGKIASVLLMVFMSRVHQREAVVERYLDRLVALARTIGTEAGHARSGDAPSIAAR